jgi:hypothetical protein
MSPHVRHLTTEEERERFHLARRCGGMCAAGGRPLEDGGTVYVEPLVLGRVDGPVPRAAGAVGTECVAPERVREAAGEASERCACQPWCRKQ